jgi:hypothetical protein
VKTIAADLLQRESVEVTARGEDYFLIEVIDARGMRSNFPPLWIPGFLNDSQIRQKLTREFREHLYPESSPDDASVPNLQTEGGRMLNS